MAFRFTQPGFRRKNRPWLQNVLVTGQGFALKTNPGCHTSFLPARFFSQKLTLATALHFVKPGFHIFCEAKPRRQRRAERRTT